ncbi:hypothetical protein LIER_03628 [Lithospermum erythrorhizon]|uniref:Uncharacterized protein n=1 Tax=Lithospermum erythrorhizon TaxID=34254 RepID=A0AAV3NTT7_LITER
MTSPMENIKKEEEVSHLLMIKFSCRLVGDFLERFIEICEEMSLEILKAEDVESSDDYAHAKNCENVEKDASDIPISSSEENGKLESAATATPCEDDEKHASKTTSDAHIN